MVDLKQLIKSCDCTKLEKENYKDELLNMHPSQWITKDVFIPVWKIHFKYKTSRGNPKKHVKFMIAGELNDYEAKESFEEWVKKYNNENSHRPLLNVNILDMEYMGILNLKIS